MGMLLLGLLIYEGCVEKQTWWLEFTKVSWICRYKSFACKSEILLVKMYFFLKQLFIVQYCLSYLLSCPGKLFMIVGLKYHFSSTIMLKLSLQGEQLMILIKMYHVCHLYKMTTEFNTKDNLILCMWHFKISLNIVGFIGLVIPYYSVLYWGVYFLLFWEWWPLGEVTFMF